jgi:Flp pilus assembly protein TadG
MRTEGRLISRLKSWRSVRGTAMIEFAIALPLLMLVLAGAIDFGSACYVAIEVSNAARAGAQYGAQNGQTMLDTSGIVLAAKNEASNILTSCTAAAGKSCWVTNYPQASYGCECADGTGVQTGTTTCSCSGTKNSVNFVLVTTQATYYPMIPWQGFNKTYTFNGMAKIRVGLQ